jgi:hypothetical protein
LVLKRFALREQFFKGGHFCLHYKKSFFEVVWVFDSVLINKGWRRRNRVLIMGSPLTSQSVSLPAGRTGRASRTDGCRISGIPACELRRSLQKPSRCGRQHVIPGGDSEVLPARGVSSPQRASSLKQRLVYAHRAGSHWEQSRCGSMEYKYHTQPN